MLSEILLLSATIISCSVLLFSETTTSVFSTFSALVSAVVSVLLLSEFFSVSFVTVLAVVAWTYWAVSLLVEAVFLLPQAVETSNVAITVVILFYIFY